MSASKPCKCRHDAAGHKILAHPDMLLYYKDDPKSLDIVRRYMPYRYVCVPHLEIHIHCNGSVDVMLYKIFPGETQNAYVSVSARVLDKLRELYKGKGGWIGEKKSSGLVIIRRKGFVTLDPRKRFGVWA